MFHGAERLTYRDHEIVVLVDAARWRDELEGLEETILGIATRSRGWGDDQLPRMRAIFKIYPLYLATSLALIFRGKRLVGIAGCDTDFAPVGGGRIVHLCAMNFLPEIQRNGVLALLMLVMIERVLSRLPSGDGTLYFTSISQSPLVYALLAKISHLYPNWSEVPPPDVIEAGTAVVAKYDADVAFEPERLILRGECDFFYRDLPDAPDARINAFVRNELDIGAGDVFVPVGRSSRHQLEAYARRFAERFVREQAQGASRRPVAAG